MRLPLQSLFERRDVVPFDSALARLYGGANVQTSAGVGVSEDSALNIAAYWRGVQLLSGQLAAMPLHLQKEGKGGVERYINSKLYKLLHDAPNPEMSAFSLRESMQSHLLTWGNAFAEIERNTIGQPIALWLITPDRVVFYRDLDDKQLKYRVAPSGRVINTQDMLHIPGLGFDGLIGYSVIGRARQSLGLTVAAERYGATFFGNGASFGGVLESQEDMDGPQRSDLRKEITEFHQGPDRAHRFLILWNGLKYSKLAMAPEEAQFLQTRKTQVVEIARWIGVPPNKLYESEGRMPGTGIEAQGIEYYTDTMLMWFEKWEQELNRKLIPALEQNYQYFEFEFSGLMRADTQARFTAYNMGKQGGWLSTNDIRGFENMSPLPDDAGGFYLAPLNMIPADKFREYIDKKITAKTTLPPAPTPTAGSGSATKDPQEAVDKALARATAAEIAAAEASGRAEAFAAEVDALRALAVVPAEQFAEAQRDAAAARSVSEAQTALAADMRKDAEALRRAMEAELSLRREQEVRAAQAEATAQQAVDAQRSAEVARDRAIEAKTFAEARATEARAERDQLTGELAEARRALDGSVGTVERLASANADGLRDLEALRMSLTAAAGDATVSATAIEALRTDLAAREARQDTTAAELVAASADAVALREQIALVEHRAATAAEAALAAETQRAIVDAQIVAARQALRDAEAVVAATETRAAEANAARELAVAESTHAHEARTAAESASAAAEGRQVALAAQLDAARRAEEAAQSAVVEARATIADFAASRDSAITASAEAADARAAADVARVAAERRQAAAEQESADAIDARNAAVAATEALRARERARTAGVLSAHRKLFVDVMRRMVERETERMHRAQATPEKLRQWVETFYGGHEELCVSALLPAVSVHVAWSGRPDDPEALTRALVAAHISESKRQLSAVLDGDAEALAGSVYALTQRWSRERVEAIADRLLKDELNRTMQGR